MKLCLLTDEPHFPRLRDIAAVWGASIVTDIHVADAVLLQGQAPALQTADLVRQERSLWVVPQSDYGSELIYKYIPLDEEFPDRLRAVWPLRLSPAVRELTRLLRSREWGDLLHLQLERVIPSGPVFSAEQAEAAWLHDADLLRSISGGEYRRVTAIHSGLKDNGISTASVSLSGEGVPDAMWALRSGGSARCELTATTTDGAAVLVWDGESEPVLTVNCKVISHGGQPPVVPPTPDALEPAGAFPAGVTPWSEAVRAFDLLDAARRSLTRRRTVELQFESTSERSQFKTHMTTIGCGLLLFTMFGLIGLLFAGRMFDPRDAQQKQSEVAGFVLHAHDFDDAELNSLGQEHLREISENYLRRSATILIETPESDSLGSQRQAHVVRALTHSGHTDAGVRTLVRPLKGQWFKRLLIVAWVLLFLPLGVFLGLQFLLGVTPADRSAQGRGT